ncbi:hypothetical protein PHLCEN_2v9625 [Hermanssonia centrifuga]|uniref:MYND-type domain-containing protein n=1 Tax=Hermanssonia centrifuga TaxID=98765 RepID=A0A2R6NQH3_9APHY|nr:hypothetical protein PHLCEN_2v9625 [Hermanssonia centrifuga]
MDVSIPPSTKLSDEALEKRLRQALNASQVSSQLITKSPINIKSLHKWPLGSSLYESVRRGNWQESMANYSSRIGGGNTEASALSGNAFMDLRQTILSLANSWDKGIRVAVMQDEDHEKCAVNIRINDKTPLITLVYQEITQENPWPGVQWVKDLIQTANGPFHLPNITASELEQKLILKLLSINAKHVPADYKVTKRRTEQDFQVSFLLPVGPLAFEDLGKLNADTGCVVCGEKTASRCSQCQSVSYCGTNRYLSVECQKEDWPKHKTKCRSLKGGTWHTLPINASLPEFEGVYATHVNRFSSLTSLPKTTTPSSFSSSSPPPNVHGEKLFLVKMQISIIASEGNLLIYDRQRSMQVYFLQTTDPALFALFKEEMDGPRGGYMGMKMYRWAKRTGDFQLSVCLDREPGEEIKW